MRIAGRHDDDRFTIRTAATLIALASVTVLLSVGASNPGMWKFTPYVLVPSFLAFLVGLAIVVVVHRTGGCMDAATMAALVAVLVTVGGGRVVELLRICGIGVIPALVVLTYWLTRRLLQVFNLRWLLPWASVTLILVNGVSAVQIVVGEVRTGYVQPSGAPSSRLLVEGEPDVVVLVLDELASPVTTPLLPAHEAELSSLERRGYEVRKTMWSSYTISAAAIPAILDGGHPLTDEDVFDESAARRLGALSRGDNRLVQGLRSVGYRFTMVESGLWMTSCGPQVDVCVESQAVDETLGVLLDRSSLRWWYERHWGDAFTASGLHSMAGARQALIENAQNGQPDLTIAHILLPHIPYLLDEGCQRRDFGHRPYTTQEAARAGYRRQAGCVVGWLTETLAELDRRSSTPPAVVVVGDHGTGLAGQLGRLPEVWTPDDAAERLAAFGAYRLPDGCPVGLIESAPQLVDSLLACLTGETPSLGRRHFLISDAGEPPEVVEYSAQDLDETLSAFSASTS